MEDQGPRNGKGKGADELARQRLGTAMLELSGELGYRAVTLELLLSRSDTRAEQFYACFHSLDDCFAAAFEAEAAALYDAMLTAAKAAGEWRPATEAALTVVLRFVVEHPQIARSLVREVHVVGGAALVKHEQFLQRLSLALGEECEALEGDLVVPRAPSFVVGAIEGVISGHLDRDEPERLLAATPELMTLISTFFLGSGE
jgi:AcrR family transcriptional regulator